MKLIDELLQRVEKLESQHSNENEIMNLDEAASFLGFTRDYLRRLCFRKLIPFYKPTIKKTYFLRSELISWVKGRGKNARRH